MVLDSGSLSKYKEQEIAEIRRKRNRRLRTRAIVIFCVVFFFFFLYSSWHKQQGTGEAELEEEGFSVEEQADLLMDQSDMQQGWLMRHATGIEVEIYTAFEGFILGWTGSADEAGKDGEEKKAVPQSFFRELFHQFQRICLRVAFFVTASFRIWVLAALLGLLIGARRLKPYLAQDILGLTGNGRLFFSGVRATLKQELSSNKLELLVPGLACPRCCNEKTLQESPLWKLIVSLGAANDTNKRLASIIVAYGGIPAFVANQGEEKALADCIESFGLEQNTCLLVENIASLHAEFRSTDHGLGGEDEGALQRHDGMAGPMSMAAYRDFLKCALRRVLQPWMRQVIRRINIEEVVTLALAMEAGKVLVFKIENGTWVRGSAFPHLSARAVLHSDPALAKNYDAAERERLRRAIVYASRYNVFGMVRFPVDLDETARAYRQWTELMLASPYELQVAADEAELFGIIASTNERFTVQLFSEVSGLEHFSGAEVYTSGTNLLLVPLKKIVELLRASINAETLKRLEELVSLVSQKQSLQEMSLERRGEEDSANIPCRILRPLAFPEMRRLVDMHKVPMDVVKDWSALRVVLSSYSWLARRVGNSSVPESALVFAVMRSDDEKTAEGARVIGREGMVPLRGSRLKERFGVSWQNHFVMVDAVTMAETIEEYERLLAMGSQAFRDKEEESGDNGRE